VICGRFRGTQVLFQSAHGSQADGLLLILRAARNRAHPTVIFALEHFEGYRRFLLASATGLFHLESLLVTSNIESLVPDWQQRRRSGLLCTDLIALDAFPPRPTPMVPSSMMLQ
jgi:heme oxygenase (biliverdin-IX-beta and delta-forming)